MRKELELFLVFAKIGTFTIGGGYAMIAMMQDELSERRNFVPKEDFMELVSVAQACPGMFALNMAVFAGSRIAGTPGALAAGLGVVLPAFFCLLAIAAFFRAFRENIYVNRIFSGLRPAVVALIAVPVFKTAKAAGITWKNAWIPALAAVLVWLAGVSPVIIVLVAIAGGLVKSMWKMQKK